MRLANSALVSGRPVSAGGGGGGRCLMRRPLGLSGEDRVGGFLFWAAGVRWESMAGWEVSVLCRFALGCAPAVVGLGSTAGGSGPASHGLRRGVRANASRPTYNDTH